VQALCSENLFFCAKREMTGDPFFQDFRYSRVLFWGSCLLRRHYYLQRNPKLLRIFLGPYPEFSGVPFFDFFVIFKNTGPRQGSGGQRPGKYDNLIFFGTGKCAAAGHVATEGTVYSTSGDRSIPIRRPCPAELVQRFSPRIVFIRSLKLPSSSSPSASIKRTVAHEVAATVAAIVVWWKPSWGPVGQHSENEFFKLPRCPFEDVCPGCQRPKTGLGWPKTWKRKHAAAGQESLVSEASNRLLP
jgi:hypothetical protein